MFEIALTGIFLALIIFYIGKLLYDKDRKIDFSVFLAISVYAFLFTFNSFSSDIFFTTTLYYTAVILFYEIAFKVSMKEGVLGGLIVHSVRFLVFALIEFIIKALEISITHSLFFMHILSALIALLIIKCLKTYCQRIIKSKGKHHSKNVWFLILINVILAVFAFLRSGSVIDLSFSIEIWFLTIFIIIIVLLTVKLIGQENKNRIIFENYEKVVNYSMVNEKLIEEYRKTLHENKNQLLVIESMLDGENKEAIKYIDQLLNSKNKIKGEWLNELKSIPGHGLKGFVTYKVMEMQEQGIDVEVVVSPELSKIDVSSFTTKDKEDFYHIIGVYLDNAREAAAEAKEKMASIVTYLEADTIKILISNTYKGEIDLDKLGQYNYSVKGQNRGTGLKLVKELIEENPLYSSETRLVHNFFLQTLTIDFNRKSSKKYISS